MCHFNRLELMDGNRLSFDETQNKRYHGRRRNATFGNIRFNRHNNDDASAGTSADGGGGGGYDPNLNVHRVREGGIKPRNVKFDTASRYKYALEKNLNSNNLKDKDNDTIMKGNNNTESTDLASRIGDRFRTRNFKNPQFRTLQNAAAQGRLVATQKKEPTKLKIGDSSEPLKEFPVQSQTHCRLKCIEQNVFDLAVNFLRQYFSCYDTRRNELYHAYHVKALYSFSVNVNSQAVGDKTRFRDSYFVDSRNLKHVPGSEKQFKLLHIGNLEIAAFIEKMPPTEHDLDSLKLDACFFSDNMFTFSVIGIYREGSQLDDKPRPYRSFQRVFVCIPTLNGQMTIVNEQCTLTNLSVSQVKKYKDTNETKTSQIEQQPATSFVSAPTPVLLVTDQANDEQRMILEFSNISNLNLTWSRDCLEYAKWDYEQAKRTFFEHKADIPLDAFKII